MREALQANLLVASRFRLVRLLGQGGMGSVWLAQHEELEIPCAVKFIEGDKAASPEFRQRFQREAKAAAKLRSPNVVQILDSGVWEDLPYIAMELLEGEELAARVARGPMAPAQVAEIVSQIARALSKAHAAGIVHRDLKPENIFLTHDVDRLLVKILDFGIAKSANTAGSTTRTGAIIGTPHYMSPEQASGTRAVDHRSDLWSLAVIAYECLTGVKPFDSEGLGELMLFILSSPIPNLMGPGLPPAVNVWWHRATSRQPDGRFPTALELADALGAALGVSAPGSPRDSIVGFAPPPSATGSFAAPDARAGLTEAGVAALSQSLTGSTKDAGAAPRRTKAPVLLAFAAGVLSVGGLLAVVITRLGGSAAPTVTTHAEPPAPPAAAQPSAAAVASEGPAVQPAPPPPPTATATPDDSTSDAPPAAATAPPHHVRKRAAPRPAPAKPSKPTKKPTDMGF